MKEIEKRKKTREVLGLIINLKKEKKVLLHFYISKSIIEEMKLYAKKYDITLGEYIEEIHKICKNINNSFLEIKKENNIKSDKISWAALIERNYFDEIKEYTKKYGVTFGEYISHIHKLYISSIK